MSNQADRGKLLENAVAEACAHYKRLRRAGIRKRFARQHVSGVWISKGDVDYSGDADGRAFYAECKETHADAIPLSLLEQRSHQQVKLADAAARGCAAGYIFGFMPEFSCWWVPWIELKDFLAQPWRRSINRNMCAAWGLQLPVTASPTGKARVLFLDGFPFAEKDRCIAAVNAERFAHPLELPLLDDDGWKPRRRKKPVKDGAHPLRGTAMDLLEMAKLARKQKGAGALMPNHEICDELRAILKLDVERQRDLSVLKPLRIAMRMFVRSMEKYPASQRWAVAVFAGRVQQRIEALGGK